jgi:hypothetical protein
MVAQWLLCRLTVEALSSRRFIHTWNDFPEGLCDFAGVGVTVGAALPATWTAWENSEVFPLASVAVMNLPARPARSVTVSTSPLPALVGQMLINPSVLCLRIFCYSLRVSWLTEQSYRYRKGVHANEEWIRE